MSPSTRGINRTVSAVTVLLVFAIAALAWVTKGFIDRNRTRLLAEFSIEQTEHLREAAREVERDLNDLADRLLFAARLVATARSEESRAHAMESLLRSSKAYHVLLATGPWGERQTARGSPPTPSRAGKLRAAAQNATAGRSVSVSRLLETDEDDDLYRVLSAAHESRAGRSAVAVLTDLSSVLHRLTALHSGSSDQLLVLGPHGLPTPASSPAVARTVRSLRTGAIDAPNLVAAVERMREGDTGSLIIDEAQARDLDLDSGDIVMAYAPIAIEGGANWSVATLRSMAPLRAHEQAVILRFGIGAGLAVLVLGALAGYAVFAGRRTAVLRERVRSSEELAAVHAQLLRAEKLATVGALAAGIAHEIGTPLGVVGGRAEYVTGKLPADHPQAESLRIIAEQVDRIARTIQALLDFSRIKPRESSAVDLGATISQCIELLRYEIDRRRLVVDVVMPAGTTVAADADQLQQVFINLLVNALAACGEGGKVVVRAARRGPNETLSCDHVAIEVADDGVGMDPADRDRAFDPFFTTKNSGEGTGLGLTIVAQIVRDHGGVVCLRAREGRGTVVEVAWPITRQAVDG